MSHTPLTPFVALAGIVCSGLLSAQMPGMPSPTVLVAPVIKGKDNITRLSIGHAEAIKEVNVRTAVEGYLQGISISNGAVVKKGDILFQIDPIRYEAEVSKIKATLAELDTNINFTAKRLERLKPLVSEGATSKEDYESTLTELEGYKARRMEAEASLKLAEKDLADCTIRAAITGRVGRIESATGNYVRRGMSLATIVQTDPIYVKFPLSQRDVIGVFQGVNNIKSVTDINLITADGFPYAKKGKIDIIDNTLSDQTDSYTFWASFENPDNVLTPEGIAAVSIKLLTEGSVLMVPLTAIHYDSKGAFVNVVTEKDKKHFFERRDVSAGNVQGKYQTIYSGLEEGETVITDGAHKIRPNAPIQVKMDESVQPNSTPASLGDSIAAINAETVEVKKIPDPTVISSQGARVENIREVSITPHVQGELIEVAFEEGSVVKKGDVLFRINPIRYKAAVEVQKARIEQLDVQIADALAKRDRQQYLFDRSATSQDDLEKAQELHEQLLSQKKAQEAMLITALDDLARCTITAAMDGRIGRVLVTEGNYITDNLPLATLIQIEPIFVRFSLSERDILTNYGSSSTMMEQCYVRVLDAAGEAHEEIGRIDVVDNVMQGGTGTRNCWAFFDNKEKKLKPGGVVTIELRRKPQFPQWSIPADAVQVDSEGYYVYIVQEGIATKRRVLVGGTSADNETVILKGLSEGDRVVSSHFSFLFNGVRIVAAQ